MKFKFTYLLTTLLFLTFFPVIAFTQVPGDCEGGRYTTHTTYIFDVESTTIQYAQNTDAAGDTIDLKMTIFTPENDVIGNRPVIILAFGGAFVAGERQSMFPLCKTYAQLGFVTVAIDYRIFPIAKLGIPSVQQMYDAAIKAVSDMKSAVRQVRRLIDHGNPYKMDGNRILIGGVSAGAVTALHAAALNEKDSLSPLIESIIAQNGGIEGNTGDSINMTYSSEVAGVINLSGALLDTTILDSEDDIVLVSMHGTADATVPFGYGKALGFIPVYGSGLVHLRALHEGLNSRLTAVDSGGHTDIYTDTQYAEERLHYFHQLDSTILEVFCSVTSVIPTDYIQDITIYPNPASSILSWKLPPTSGKIHIGVFNQVGERVIDKSLSNGSHILDISELSPGIYFFYLKADSQDTPLYKARFIKVK